jgi:CRP/FNR family transcriptional regulator, cyclic AMP receptor protein
MSGVTPAALGGHAFLHGMAGHHLATLSRACWVAPLRAGHRLFEEGGTAQRFWLLQSGQIALDLNSPGRSGLIVETLGPGDLVGLSWFVPPYQWQFGATAVQDTVTFELNAIAVRAACEEDPVLGYALLRRVMSAASSRLHATRVRMLDLYGGPGTGQDQP